MIQKVFAVRDSKAQAFLQPFFSAQNGTALRAMSDAVQDPKSPFHAHPEDYVLYELGTFDDQTGAFEGLSTIRLLAMAVDFVEPGGKVPNRTMEDLIAVGSDVAQGK